MKKILTIALTTATLISGLTFTSLNVKANEIPKNEIQVRASYADDLIPFRKLAEKAHMKVEYHAGIITTIDRHGGTKSMIIDDILRNYPNSVFKNGTLYMTQADFEDAFYYYN